VKLVSTLLVFAIVGYAWFTFPEGKSDCDGQMDDGSTAVAISEWSERSARSILSGEVDECAGWLNRWELQSLAIPRSYGMVSDAPQSTYDCFAKLDVGVLGIYVGWRDLGLPSCLAHDLTPSPIASTIELKGGAELLLEEASRRN
jgi:hypothetical protein